MSNTADKVKCSACGYMNLPKYLTFTTTRGTNDKWIKCTKCRGFFLSMEYDNDTEALRAEGEDYGDEIKGKELNIYKERMFKYAAECVREFESPPKALLDIGCSYGGFLFIAKEYGFEVEGTDIVQPAIDYVKSKGIEAYKCFSVKELNSEKKYDIITALDCNYYWGDQPGELNEIYKKLKPNGLFVMRVVDKSWTVKTGLAVRKVFENFGNKIIRRGLNDHRFSMPFKSLKALLANMNFEILKISITGARHSYDSGFGVKLSFVLGSVINSLTGMYLAPGEIIVLRKNG